MTATDLTAAQASRAVPSIADRDALVDRILAGLAEMPSGDRLDLLVGIVSTLHGMSPKGADLLAHRARLAFWRAALDLAHLDAGAEPADRTLPAARSLSATDLRRHLERRAWAAATTLPVRTVADLLPRPLSGLADDIARIIAPRAPGASTH